MKTPSIKTLSQVFEDPKKAKEVFQMTRAELAETPAGKELMNKALVPAFTAYLRLTVLSSLDSGLFGVESAESANGNYADYLNTGDIYNPTVIYWRGNYRVQSLGDFIETMERQGVKFN